MVRATPPFASVPGSVNIVIEGATAGGGEAKLVACDDGWNGPAGSDFEVTGAPVNSDFSGSFDGTGTVGDCEKLELELELTAPPKTKPPTLPIPIPLLLLLG